MGGLSIRPFFIEVIYSLGAVYNMTPFIGCPKDQMLRVGVEHEYNNEIVEIAGLGDGRHGRYCEIWNSLRILSQIWQMQQARALCMEQFTTFLVNLVYVAMGFYHILERCLWNNLVFVLRKNTFSYAQKSICIGAHVLYMPVQFCEHL